MAPVAESKIAPRVPEITLTGYLRFFNIWEDLFRRQLFGPGKTVTILGMGLERIDGEDHCPQLSEAMHFYDNSTIACFDSNPEVLTAMQSMDHEPATPLIHETFAINPKPAQEEAQMKKVLDYLTRVGEQDNEMQYESFRMGEDDPKRLPESDVMIATYSMMYPLIELWKSNPEARLDFFIQYVSRLKKGGILYVDTDCAEYLLRSPEDAHLSAPTRPTCLSLETLQGCLQEILKRSKIQLKVHFLKQNLACHVGIKFGVIQPASCKKNGIQSNVETKDVFTFERLK